MKALSPEIECRAWTTLAQVGLQVIGSRLSASPNERHAWTRNIEAEVLSTRSSPQMVMNSFISRSTEQSLRVYVGFLTQVLIHIDDPHLAEHTSPTGDPSRVPSKTEADNP